jgi:hypothetical protein
MPSNFSTMQAPARPSRIDARRMGPMESRRKIAPKIVDQTGVR